MGAHLETILSLSSVYGFRGIAPRRPTVLSHSVVYVHIAVLPTHTVWLIVAVVCQLRALFSCSFVVKASLYICWCGQSFRHARVWTLV